MFCTPQAVLLLMPNPPACQLSRSHPRVGISNLPISSEILKNLVTEAELNDVYSSMPCGMINQELLSQPLDPIFQDTIASSVAEVVEAEATIETHSKTYSVSQDSRKAKRLKTSALGNAVIPAETKKGKACDDVISACDNDIYSIRWMQLLAEHDPQEPVDLKELKSARIGSVFPIICCINNKDITNKAIGHHAS